MKRKHIRAGQKKILEGKKIPAKTKTKKINTHARIIKNRSPKEKLEKESRQGSYSK